MDNGSKLKDWVPLFSSLVTPLFAITLILWFRADVGDFLEIIKKAVGEQQRSLEIGDFIKIGESARTTPISKMNLGDISVPLSEHMHESWVIEKGGTGIIQSLREESEKHKGKPVDAMILKEGVRYSTEALGKYVNLLGVKYVLFTLGGKFDSWISSGLFMGQLRPGAIYTIEELKRNIIGLNREHAYPTAKASEVLQQMQDLQTDQVAIVSPTGEYQYIIQKQDILAKLISSMILAEAGE